MFRFSVLVLFFIFPFSLAFAEQANSSAASSSSSLATQYVDNEQEFYAPYAKVLDKYVDLRGRVDYKKLKASRVDLDQFIDNLKKLRKSEFDLWQENDRIALWINVYNALTLKVILDNYPIKPSTANTLTFPSNSIRQIVGAWTGFKHEVMGRSLTLDEIAHTILRGEFKEPRVHIALCPASVGAPMLRREAYLGKNLVNQLVDQSKYFLRDPAKFFLDKEGKQVLVSPVFDWYAADFLKTYSEAQQFKRYSKEIAATLQFLTTYLAEEEADYIKTRPLKVSFLEYDWNLNDQNPAPTIAEAVE